MKEFLSDLIKRLTSRKFISALVVAVVVFGNSYFDWGLDPQEVLVSVLGLLAFIGFEGYRDIKAVK